MVNKNEYKYVVRKLLASCRSDIELLSVPGDTKMHIIQCEHGRGKEHNISSY